MKRMLCALVILILLVPILVIAADPSVFEASGAEPGDILAEVNAFRNFLGNNNGVGGTFGTGRREINWDGVPDAFSDPNFLPPNFFNSNSPRGVVFFTLGSGFKVSANLENPTNTPVRFGSIHPSFPDLFSTFSPERLFSAIDSQITEILFFVPGTSHAATVNGFGAVFTDVNVNDSTKIEYFDVNGKLLISHNVLPGAKKRGSLSFLGVGFDSADVYFVRITSGNRVLTTRESKSNRNSKQDSEIPSETLSSSQFTETQILRGFRRHRDSEDSEETEKSPKRDVVVMDDFIYGEPQPVP